MSEKIKKEALKEMFDNMSLSKSEMEFMKGGDSAGGDSAGGAANNPLDIACICWPGCREGCASDYLLTYPVHLKAGVTKTNFNAV